MPENKAEVFQGKEIDQLSANKANKMSKNVK